MDASLSNRDGFTVFQFGRHVIRFRAPYSLEKYTKVKEIPHNARGASAGEFQPSAVCKNLDYLKEWNKGYLVVDAKYQHNSQDEEEYIDLIPILQDLYFDPAVFLAPIEGVRIAYD